MPEKSLAVFEGKQIRRHYDEKTGTWYFSIVDIVQVLVQQPDYQVARKYWNKLKERLKKEGSESVTNCHRLKLEAADGKKYLTDVASPETLLRLIQSVPSPKAEPIKLWLAKVGYERMQDMADSARSLDRAREFWQQHGRSEKWIQQRMMSQEAYAKRTRRRVLGQRSGRDDKWTDSLAVGSKDFVDKVKAKLGILAKGRDARETEGGFQLREPANSYPHHFEAKKDDVGPENTYFLDVND